jgi:hypothetical protein
MSWLVKWLLGGVKAYSFVGFSESRACEGVEDRQIGLVWHDGLTWNSFITIVFLEDDDGLQKVEMSCGISAGVDQLIIPSC